MIAALRRHMVDDVLRSLSALGARVECRGDKIVLLVGARPVPPDLITAAREAKAELSKMLNSPKMLNSGEGEHLRRVEVENPRVSAASLEGVQPSESELLRVGVRTFDQSEDFRTTRASSASKALTEDAHLSTFDGGEDFCGSQRDPVSKVLNSPHVSIYGPGERVPSTWGEAEEERTATIEHEGAIPRIGIPEIADEPVLLRDGRRLWRFPAAEDCAADRAGALIDQALWCGAVLVADARELLVVERWLSNLPVETLCELRRCASGVISVLQQRSRAPRHLNTPREDR